MATFTRDLSSGFELDPAHDIRNVHGAPGWTELQHARPRGGAGVPVGGVRLDVREHADGGRRLRRRSVQGHGVGGVRAPQPGEDAAPTWRTYVAVEDAGELVRRVEEAGGSLPMEPFDMPQVGRIVAFQHPAAGRLLALEYLQPFA